MYKKTILIITAISLSTVVFAHLQNSPTSSTCRHIFSFSNPNEFSKTDAILWDYMTSLDSEAELNKIGVYKENVRSTEVDINGDGINEIIGFAT